MVALLLIDDHRVAAEVTDLCPICEIWVDQYDYALGLNSHKLHHEEIIHRLERFKDWEFGMVLHAAGGTTEPTGVSTGWKRSAGW